jgi:hypothetical protein
VSFLDPLVCHFDHGALDIKVLRLNIYLTGYIFSGREESVVRDMLMQGKEEKKRKPDYQFAVIHDALYPLLVVHQPPRPTVKMLNKSINDNRSWKVLLY